MKKKELIELLNNNLFDSGNSIRIFRKYKNSYKRYGDYPVATIKMIIDLIEKKWK